jgi:putative peptidoglycan lipid II flippase
VSPLLAAAPSSMSVRQASPRLSSLTAARRKRTSGLKGATVLLTLAAVVGKPITFGRDVAVAHSFGASSTVDFVILAQIVPMLFVGFVSGGAVLSLPAIYRRVSSGSAADGLPMTKAYVARLLRYEAIALAIGIGLAVPLLSPSAPRAFALPVLLFVFLSAQALCESASAMYSQLLQIDGRFGRSAIQSCLNGAVSIVVIVVLAPDIGIWAWPAGMLTDALWQAAFLHVSLKSNEAKAALPRISARDLLVAVGPPLILFGLTAIYSVTDRVAGLAAGVGTLALWTWALRVGNTTTGLISQPIATVVFSRGHLRGAREPVLYGAALCLSLVLALVAVGGYELVGPRIVRLLFGGGRVSPRNLGHLVTLTRLAILAGIPLSLFTVTSRACAARGNFRPVIIAFGIGAAMYPGMIAIGFAQLGYRSLGVAYVVASLTTALLNLETVRRRGWLRLSGFRTVNQTA